MRFVMLGLPGAGKGTQARFLSERFVVPHISTGDMVREAMEENSAPGIKARHYVERGELVPDETMVDLLKERVSAADCAKGFVIDGFPRTRYQAESLKRIDVQLDYVIEIDVSENDVLRRMSGRRVHPPSGRVYHVIFNPPKVAGKDDITGEDLVQRPDDRRDIVMKRIGSYHLHTKPLLLYYVRWWQSGDSRAPRFVKVFGFSSIAQVRDRVFAALKDSLPESVSPPLRPRVISHESGQSRENARIGSGEQVASTGARHHR